MNEGVSGATSAGITSEMIALGGVDSYLVKGATMSFFRFRYAKHTNFAMEPIYQSFNTTTQFGGNSEILLNRNGDLIYFMYVVIDLPAIVACRQNQTQCAGFRGFQGINTFPSLSLAPNQCDGCPTNYKTAAQLQNQAYFDQFYAGSKEAYLTDQYCNRACQDGSDQDPFSDTSSFRREFFCETGGPCPEPVPFAYWHNAVGQKIVERASAVVGGIMMASLFSDFLYMWEELSGKAGKYLTEMIGKRNDIRQLIADAQQNQRLYVPLPFSFTQNSGNAFPLTSLQYNGLKIHVKFEELRRLIVTSHPDVQVYKSCDFTPLTNNDLSAWLDTTYIYLDVMERNRFATANFDQLITQVQYYTNDERKSQIHIPMRFNHPVIELIWAVRRKINFEQNNSFNYSGINGRDPVTQAIIKFNNQPRIAARQGSYFRLVQPYQFHSSIPKAHIYNYSFALDPESPQPTGSVNFSRIDNAELILDLQAGLEQEVVTVILFARSWNIFRFIEGVGGVLFTA
jgi:hypothetical protein